MDLVAYLASVGVVALQPNPAHGPAVSQCKATNPAISADGKLLIYIQVDEEDSTIMLVNHFN